MSKVSVPLFRTQYDGLNEQVSLAHSISFPPPEENPFSAIQSEAKDCDLNLIVKSNNTAYFERFQARVASGQYLDLANLPDYVESQNIMVRAQEAFMDLPADIRKEFGNDPAAFLDFIDRGDRSEFERLGLVPPTPLNEAHLAQDEPKPKKATKVAADNSASPEAV